MKQISQAIPFKLLLVVFVLISFQFTSSKGAIESKKVLTLKLPLDKIK